MDAPVALSFYLRQIYELMAAYRTINYPQKLIPTTDAASFLDQFEDYIVNI